MKLTREDVLRVAELAHLELSEAEIETFSKQLDSILSYSDKLNEVDTSSVEPLAQVAPPKSASGSSEKRATMGTPLREDVVVPSKVVTEVLAGAPDPSPPYFRVPKVIDK